MRTFKPSEEVAAAAFSPDARTLVAGTVDGRALLWSVDTGALLKALPHAGAVNAVDFTSDGRLIVTGSEDGMVRVWESASGLLLRTIEIGEPVHSLSLQPGGRDAAVVTRQNSARVVDRDRCDRPDLDQPGGITVASFSPSGDVVVAGRRRRRLHLGRAKLAAQVHAQGTQRPRSPTSRSCRATSTS